MKNLLTADPDAPEFRDAIQDLFGRIAPHDSTVRIVFASMIPADLSECGILGVLLSPGYVSHGAAALVLDVAVRAEVEAHAIRAKASKVKFDFRRHLAQRLLAVSLHEFAHAMELPVRLVPEKDSSWKRLKSDLQTNLDIQNGETWHPPWAQHGPRFIRIAAHVAYRASRLGLPICLGDLVDTRSYGLDWWPRYFRPLRPELRRRRRDSFQAILASPAPPAFDAMFYATLRDWRGREAQRDKSRPDFPQTPA